MKRTSGSPVYSIVIPCYNEADYIENTLTSLKAQDTTASFEVIVVDNNCSDETAAIARRFGVTVIQEKTPGVTAARQTGTTAARGEIVISTDADTTFAPSWLETIHQEFQAYPHAVAVCGPCQYVEGPWWSTPYTSILFGFSAWYASLFKHPFYVSATNIAFRKANWHGYDPNVPQGGDELGLLSDLKKQGVVRFNNRNPTYTSSRRLTKGLCYSIFVTFLFYYIIGYNLDRMFKRRIIGSAPHIRLRPKVSMAPYSEKKRLKIASLIGGVFMLAAGTVIFSELWSKLSDAGSDAFAFIQRIIG